MASNEYSIKQYQAPKTEKIFLAGFLAIHCLTVKTDNHRFTKLSQPLVPTHLLLPVLILLIG